MGVLSEMDLVSLEYVPLLLPAYMHIVRISLMILSSTGMHLLRLRKLRLRVIWEQQVRVVPHWMISCGISSGVQVYDVNLCLVVKGMK